jgi:hypothetical protein
MYRLRPRRRGEGKMTTADDEQAFEEKLAYCRRLVTETLNEIREADPHISRERLRELLQDRVDVDDELRQAVVMCAAQDQLRAYIKQHGN